MPPDSDKAISANMELDFGRAGCYPNALPMFVDHQRSRRPLASWCGAAALTAACNFAAASEPYRLLLEMGRDAAAIDPDLRPWLADPKVGSDAVTLLRAIHPGQRINLGPSLADSAARNLPALVDTNAVPER
jgi:hypothetical protein